MNDLNQVPGAGIVRATYRCKVPPGAAQSEVEGFGLITSIGLHLLTASDEMVAAQRARGDVMRLAYEMARQCVGQVNGKPISTAEGALDTFWERCHPSLRTIIVSAYTKLNQPKQGDLDSFLASMEIIV